jgi:hypothetical protein
MKRWLVVFAVGVLAVVAGSTDIAEAGGESRAYVRKVSDRQTFERYSRVLGSDRFGKFIIDIKTDDIYFIDVNLFKLHADFVLGVLLKQEWTADNIRRYNKNYERDKPAFILGYVTEHIKVGKLTFSFWEGDKIDAAGVRRVSKKLAESFFVKDLPFRPDSPAQHDVARQAAQSGVPTISNDKIYKDARYQAFNKGESVGVLRVVPRGTAYESLTFERTDIVILQEAYPDISPVAGIMSTVFSTPLAHVNLRATSWGIPNAGYVDAFAKHAGLDGKYVYYRVEDTSHVLREATAEEVEKLKNRINEQKTVEVPPADLQTANMPMLTRIRTSRAGTYGAKTANLGEIASAGVGGVAVPPGFGLPFFYYVRHMRRHGLDKKVEALLADPRWTDTAWRKAGLEVLQKAIRAAPMEPAVIDAIYKRVRIKLGGRGVFIRSSTNAEDLPGFNGAGLYDTVPNVRGKKALGDGVKQVWASLWNFRAVQERELFGIDHRKVYAGVMIQVGVDATAAGVLVTDNLFNPEETDAFTINANWGLGIRTVEGTRVPEQIVFDTSNDGTKIISRSDEPHMLVFDRDGGIREIPNPHTGVILTEERAKRLAEAVIAFLPLFDRHEILDVEWLFEGEKVWIVQCRPYVTSGRR